jgi:hypothetical protein
MANNKWILPKIPMNIVEEARMIENNQLNIEAVDDHHLSISITVFSNPWTIWVTWNHQSSCSPVRPTDELCEQESEFMASNFYELDLIVVCPMPSESISSITRSTTSTLEFRGLF